jgi:hypothetical protein
MNSPNQEGRNSSLMKSMGDKEAGGRVGLDFFKKKQTHSSGQERLYPENRLPFT